MALLSVAYEPGWTIRAWVTPFVESVGNRASALAAMLLSSIITRRL
jgi:hypothetical protein